jgi:hypothetical protein
MPYHLRPSPEAKQQQHFEHRTDFTSVEDFGVESAQDPLYSAMDTFQWSFQEACK